MCFTFNHTALYCAQLRGSGQQPSTHLTVGNVSDNTWFSDKGTNQHVTPNIATLTDYASYLGNDHLHVGDDKGLAISYIGHSTLHSPKCIFKLSNVLHVPHITKPLLFIDKFYHDNNVYFEFHVSVFYIKDIITKKVLLSGQSNDGLYVLSESSATSIPQTYWSLCVSATADL